jgi:hypothetical protein
MQHKLTTQEWNKQLGANDCVTHVLVALIWPRNFGADA